MINLTPMPASRKPFGNAPRRAGRPAGDERDLREALLEAAIARFVRVGIDAASLRSIAVEGGATAAMLHYYFGDKQQLVRTLIDERLIPALEVLLFHLDRAGDTPAELVSAFVQGVAEMVRRNPWLPHLWVREVLCEGGALREAVQGQIAPRLLRKLAQRFAVAQAAGGLPKALDPRLLVVSLAGLTLFPAASAPVWGEMFDTRVLGPDIMARHTLALLGRGIGADLGDAA